MIQMLFVFVVLVGVLQQMGMTHDAATQTISQVMMGVGGVWALIGFIRGLIKQYQGKQQKPVPAK